MVAIAYDLLISSASRPHLLRQVIANIFTYVDQPPARVFVHEDIQGPEYHGQVWSAVRDSVPENVPLVYLEDDPPILHGPTIHRLLMASDSEFVMYAQDDDAPIRPVPARDTLAVMARYGLNQVRYNKRVTMANHRGWPKREVMFEIDDEEAIEQASETAACCVECEFGGDVPSREVTLTLSEKFHFTFSLWNRAYVAAVADWWETTRPGSIREHGEAKLGEAMSGVWPDFNATKAIEVPEPGTHLDHAMRMRVCKTYIYGKIGDPPFTDHIGWHKEDWRLPRTNRSGLEYARKLAEQGEA